MPSLISRTVTLAAIAALLAGCSAQDGEGGSIPAPTNPEATATGTAPPPETPAQPASGAEDFSKKTESYTFEYKWPAVVNAIAPLRERLTTQRDRRLKSFAEKADAWQAEKDERGLDAPGYGYGKEWKVVTDLPRFLSLSASVYEFQGGAHGMTTFDALVWDRTTGSALKPVDMFLSPSALDRATQDRFCTELDRQRARKRGGPVERSDNAFDACISPTENATVILGSASGDGFDRVGFLVPPYNAGPYAEGDYEVTLTVDAALLDAVKPRYQRFFLVGG